MGRLCVEKAVKAAREKGRCGILRQRKAEGQRG